MVLPVDVAREQWKTKGTMIRCMLQIPGALLISAVRMGDWRLMGHWPEGDSDVVSA
jgi:hypothetical protein